MKLSVKLFLLMCIIMNLHACASFRKGRRMETQRPRRKLVVVSEDETKEVRSRRELVAKEEKSAKAPKEKKDISEEETIREEELDYDLTEPKKGLDIPKETVSIFKPYDPEKDKEEIQIPPEGPIPPEIKEELLGREVFPEEPVTLNFEDAPIEQILNAVSETLGINFIMASNVKGSTITMQTTKPVPASELFTILQSVLEVNGITLVRSGRYYKVVKSQEAKQYPIEVLTGKESDILLPEDTFITQIVPLDYIPVKEMVGIIKPFLSKSAPEIIQHEDLNIMIINDLSSNIRRLLTFVNELDKPIYQPDEKVYVYYVKNGDAEKLATTLNSIYKDKQKTKTKEPQFQTVQRRLPDGSVQSFKVPVGGPYAHLMQGQEVTGTVQIVSDKEINALIIITSPKDYEAVMKTIAKLDILPKQALIEAMIVDVALDDTTEFGINWKMFLEGKNPDIGVGGETQTLQLGTDSEFLTYNVNLDNFLGALKMLSKTNKMNIVSRPHIMALDNNEAQIEIVEEFPITQTEYNVDAKKEVTTTVYKKAGITLKVTPHINENEMVTLDIRQKVSEPSSVSDGSYINREATSKVVVKGGSTIVIGGLIQKKREKIKSGIPILCDLPILGYLFGETKYGWSKTELLIFITPHVVTTQEEIQQLTNEYRNKTQKLKEMIEETQEETEMPHSSWVR
ncbi:MAG: secretin N-terminal domain-containing protein [bacterium]